MTEIGLATFINIFAYAIRFGLIAIVLKYKQRLDNVYVYATTGALAKARNGIYAVAIAAPCIPDVKTLLTSLNLNYTRILVLHILTRPRLSYSGQMSPIRIILTENSLPSVGAADVTIPVAASSEILYYFYLYLEADSCA